MAVPFLTEPLSMAGRVKIGPFLSVTDGVTPVTVIITTNVDIRLSKNNGAFAQKHEATGIVGGTGNPGWFNVVLDDTDVDTTGQLLIAMNVAGALPVWRKFQVQGGGGG